MTDNFKYGEETKLEKTTEKRANFSGGLGYILAVSKLIECAYSASLCHSAYGSLGHNHCISERKSK